MAGGFFALPSMDWEQWMLSCGLKSFTEVSFSMQLVRPEFLVFIREPVPPVVKSCHERVLPSAVEGGDAISSQE